MPKVKLNDPLIKNLRAEDKRVEYWDKDFQGGAFGVRVTESGHKSFVVMYRHKGRKRRMTLGTFPSLSLAQARKEARENCARALLGEDPQDEKMEGRRAETFKELGELYLKRHARVNKKPVSAKEDERILEVYLYPRWRARKIQDIRRADVIAVLDDIAHGKRKAPVMANRIRALISKIFNFALARDLVEYNPCSGVPKLTKDRSRKTVLTDEQIKIFWEELDRRKGGPVGEVFKMILITGQRPGECTQMRWDQIVDGAWIIPSEVAKNGREHHLPLPSLALDLIERQRAKSDGSGYVFPSYKGGHVRWLQSMARRLNTEKDENGNPVLPFHFRPHDLRRTAATGLARLGVHRDVIGKTLNHKSADNTVTAIYDRYDRMPEMKRALERWAGKLEQILTGEPAKVVKIRR